MSSTMHFIGNRNPLPLIFMLTKSDQWLKANTNVVLLEAVQKSNLQDVSTMGALRKLWSMEEISIAGELIQARERAVGKLENATRLLADRVGVQQASSTQIAEHKAKRFISDSPILDLCCGIGSDLRALPMQTVGVEIDPLRCTMACFNSGKKTICENVLSTEIQRETLVHIDPSRRSSTQRLHSLEAMEPNIEELSGIVASCAGGCIKVSPAVNTEDLESFESTYELEYIEENGRVVQGLIWFGTLAYNAGQVTATSMTLGTSVTGTPDYPSFNSTPQGWVLEPNPALERARLHGTVGNQISATELAPNLGLLCANTNPCSPWFTPFEIITTTPLRIEKVAKQLREEGCTQVEVKTRGKTIDPNEWQNKLSSKSSGPLLTIFALRIGKKRVAVITRRSVQS
jgi:hypothetical protein